LPSDDPWLPATVVPGITVASLVVKTGVGVDRKMQQSRFNGGIVDVKWTQE